MDGPCSTYGRKQKRVQGLCLEKVMEGEHVGDVGGEERMILKCTLNKYDVKMWTGLMWLSIVRIVTKLSGS
jgi:hypothetical protein